MYQWPILLDLLLQILIVMEACADTGTFLKKKNDSGTYGLMI